MTIAILAALLASLAPIKDWNGHPVPRPAGVLDAIAQVALEHPNVDARLLAITLDVLGAHESGYSAKPRGSNDHGASKGFGQTPRASTPDDLLGQIREAARWVIVSWRTCPEYPLSRYATGIRCTTKEPNGKEGVWMAYQRQVETEYAAIAGHDQ
jgi:hypothetical protein